MLILVLNDLLSKKENLFDNQTGTERFIFLLCLLDTVQFLKAFSSSCGMIYDSHIFGKFTRKSFMTMSYFFLFIKNYQKIMF